MFFIDIGSSMKNLYHSLNLSIEQKFLYNILLYF